MWPVILRELRAESRRPFTYWLRVIGALAILITILFTIYQSERWAVIMPWGTGTGAKSTQLMGRLLFGNVNAALFALIWLLVPLLTADCITREKREGTLGLLFLTPLTARGIVVGKAFVHGLRALTFMLTMLPVLAVPLLMGGVDPKDLVMALLVDSTALLLALAAGLIASSWTKQWMSAVLLAETLSFLFAITMMRIHLACFESIIASANTATGNSGGAGRGALIAFAGYSQVRHYYGHGFLESLLGMFHFNTAADAQVSSGWIGGMPGRVVFGGIWSTVWTSGKAVVIQGWFAAAIGILGSACVFVFIAILLAAERVRRSWRMQTPTARAMKLDRQFCQPRFLPALFRKRMTRSLERNPVGWLQQYSVSARLTKWGWCFFVVLVECLLSLNINDVSAGQAFVFMVLLLALAFSAAGSFRRERETGALELLLVTPLRVPQIIFGRLGGLWRQFLPATLIAFLAALYVSSFGGSIFRDGAFEELGAVVGVLCGSFITIPIVGLHFSLRRGNYLVAWLSVLTSTLVIPWCMALLWTTWKSLEGNHESRLLVFLSVQLGVTAFAGARLVANLSARRFVTAA